jgi:hypothetical protein
MFHLYPFSVYGIIPNNAIHICTVAVELFVFGFGYDFVLTVFLASRHSVVVEHWVMCHVYMLQVSICLCTTFHRAVLAVDVIHYVIFSLPH